MANTVVARVDESKLPVISGIGAYVASFFLAWLALILVLGARGAFVTPGGGPPLALLISLVAPLTLFLVGFLVLFLELACIRWFAAYVIFLQFFTNVVLLASFLGMSCGCMAARKRYDWLGQFPALALFTVTAALVMLAIYQGWTGLAVDVGHQSSPQEVFFGTEYRNPDVAQFAIPIELIVAIFFLLISLLFVGLGQALGRAFDAYPNRVVAYTLNIGGSLAGIVAFTGMSKPGTTSAQRYSSVSPRRRYSNAGTMVVRRYSSNTGRRFLPERCVM